jgi:phosphate acetyltransferase
MCFKNLIDTVQTLPTTLTAVAHPCDEASLAGAAAAAQAGIITPILVGPHSKITATAEAAGIDISGYEIVDADYSHAAATVAVALVREGRAAMLMKGSLSIDELLAAVVKRDTGLRTERRLSHCFIMDIPSHSNVLIVTDAAINIFPTLEEKVDITQNAIDLAHALDISQPKVAILSATEKVNPKLQTSIEAAALCKMADRGQIRGGLLDGPLALDNAISPEAARIRGIQSSVAGQADILIVPDLEAGNMLAESMSFMMDADSAGIVLGARVPITLTSRADSMESRLASCAVAVMEKGIQIGLEAEGEIPGGLGVRRHAKEIYDQIRGETWGGDLFELADHINGYALAVMEVNATLGQVVTAPTMGASGIVPAVLQAYKKYGENVTDDLICDFLLTSGGCAIPVKINASFSGAGSNGRFCMASP